MTFCSEVPPPLCRSNWIAVLKAETAFETKHVIQFKIKWEERGVVVERKCLFGELIQFFLNNFQFSQQTEKSAVYTALTDPQTGLISAIFPPYLCQNPLGLSLLMQEWCELNKPFHPPFGCFLALLCLLIHISLPVSFSNPCSSLHEEK